MSERPMHTTIFAEALSPATLERLREMQGEAADHFDSTALTDAELEAELTARLERAAKITDTLADDAEQGYILKHLGRHRLAHERFILNGESAQLRAEIKRRKKVIVAARYEQKKPRGPSPEQLEFERKQQEAAAVRRAEKQAKAEHYQRVNTEVQNLFVRAAFRVLGDDQFQVIWAKAREMFPDAPAWAQYDAFRAEYAAKRDAKRALIEDGFDSAKGVGDDVIAEARAALTARQVIGPEDPPDRG